MPATRQAQPPDRQRKGDAQGQPGSACAPGCAGPSLWIRDGNGCRRGAMGQPLSVIDSDTGDHEVSIWVLSQI